MTVNELIKALKKLSKEEKEYDVHIAFNGNFLDLRSVHPSKNGKCVDVEAYCKLEEEYYENL